MCHGAVPSGGTDSVRYMDHTESAGRTCLGVKDAGHSCCCSGHAGPCQPKRARVRMVERVASGYLDHSQWREAPWSTRQVSCGVWL